MTHQELILCNGMQRSGSTWLFNVVRLIVSENTAASEFAAGWHLDSPTLKAVSVLKVHGVRMDLLSRARIVLYSYRDIRDAIASRRRIWGTPPTMELANAWVSECDFFEDRADFVMRYESMITDPTGTVSQVANTLGYSVDSQSIVEQVAALPNPGEGHGVHHPVSLLHRGHVTNGKPMQFREELPDSLLAEIERVHADWLLTRGYQLVTR